MASAEYAQLVEFLERRFDAIDQRFDAIGRQFAAIDRQFAEVHREIAELRQEMLGHFDELYRRLERLEQEHHAIAQGLRRIEAALAGERGRSEILERGLAELKQQVAALQSRIEEIEQRLGS